MRTLAKIAVVLLFTASAFAQRVSFSTAVSHSVGAHFRDQLAFSSSASDSGSHRRWYWEDTSPTGSTTPVPMDRSAIFFANNNDFSPVGLSWTFSGKHPLVPTFEIAGFDMKPGPQPLSPDAHYGFIAPPRMWSRAGHALIAALRY